MSGRVRIRIWTMSTAGLTEPAVAAWCTVLDADEHTRADRFVFGHHRLTYIAAHALTRIALSAISDGTHPAAWRFVAGAHGKPVAWLGDRPAPLTFNLSHTDGMVGLAVMPMAGHALGFDLEALDRKVTLDIADRYFCPQEIAWLAALAEADRPSGFLWLWTLKEAFIKATGDGLAQDLATFWFEPMLPRIHFTAALAERASDWHFEQRMIDGRFVAAVGLRRPDGITVETDWTETQPDELRL